MQTTIADLQDNMQQVLAALSRNEEISVLYRGKKIADLVPVQHTKKMSMKEHPFFGMLKEEEISVADQMNKLRDKRYHDI